MGLKDLVNKYDNKGSGGNFKKYGWLSLKNDGDVANVRFLCKGITGRDSNGEPKFDFDAYEVHEVEIDGYKRKVICLGDGCPLCEAGNKASLRIWIPVLDLDETDAEKKEKLWERGLTEIKKLISLCEEYGDLSARDWKIKRNGKAGSTKTFYEFFNKDKSQRQLPEKPQVHGRYALDLSAMDMEMVLDGTFTFKKDDDGDDTDTF